MPDATLRAVAEEVHHAIAGLEALLERQKQTSRRRLLFMVAVYVPLSMVIAMFITIGTVSICFLGSSGEPPIACRAIPGYNAALEADQELVREFQRFNLITERNAKRIRRLEQEHK